MKRMIIRYKVKANRAIENERYITGVFEQLKRENPSGLRYAAFKLDDGVSFVHIVSLEAADGSHPLNGCNRSRGYRKFCRIRKPCRDLPHKHIKPDLGKKCKEFRSWIAL